MKTRIMGILTVALLCFVCVTPVAATTGIAPFWANTQSIILSQSFSGGQATASSIINGNSNTASITATYILKEQTSTGWTTVKTWPQVSVTGKTLTFTNTASATAGKTYRLSVTAVVTNNAGTPETVTEYNDKTY